LTCARHSLTLNEENLDWNLDLQQTLEVLWGDTSIKTVYTDKNYFLDNFSRIVQVEYFPTDDDVSKLEELYTGEPEPEVIVSNNSTNVSTTNNTTTNTTNNNVTTNNNTTNNLNNSAPSPDIKTNDINLPDMRAPSVSVSNPNEQAVLLLITVPTLNITKLLKASAFEKAPEVIEKLRKKPGVILTELTPNYVCWLNRSDQAPVPIDNNMPLLTYNLKNNDPIMLLKIGEKPEDFIFTSFHNTTNSPKEKKEKGKRKTISISKIGKKKKKDKEKKDKDKKDNQ